jgi:hypothetical protein
MYTFPVGISDGKTVSHTTFDISVPADNAAADNLTESTIHFSLIIIWEKRLPPHPLYHKGEGAPHVDRKKG